MDKETSGKSKGNEPTKRHKVFKNFAEYWHFVKVLSQPQREVLVQSLSKDEQRALHTSFQRGGWNDLMMRNVMDQILTTIKTQTGVDLLDIRTKVIMGRPQLMQRGFWEHVNKCFDGVSWEHIAYIFNGMIVEEYDTDYYKLIYYRK